MKACSVCGVFKLITAFSADARRKDGKCSKCKACASAAFRDWYARNAKAEVERTMAWQRDNPGRVRRYNAKKRAAGKQSNESIGTPK